MFAWELMRSLAISDERGLSRFVSMQNHYNLIYREEEREMMPLCEFEDLAVIPWSPLARGMLAGSRAKLGDKSTTRSETDGLDQILYNEVAVLEAPYKAHPVKGLGPKPSMRRRR
jgi:aryl-alcohol dehydrogenase-like predicted oxidoreductase